MMQRRRGRRVWVLLAGLLAFSGAGEAWGQAQGPQRMVITLRDAVRRAVNVSPEVREVRMQVEAAKAKKQQADSARLPQGEAIGLLGPSPQARGDQVSSPDTKTRISGLDAFEKITITLIQPLYTFGKISGFREAAERNILVQEAKVDEKVQDVILRTKQIYYGLRLAKEVQNLILEIQDQLDQTITKTEGFLRRGSPEADEVDLHKLRTFAAEVRRNRNEAEKGLELARAALRAFLNLPEDVEVEPAEARLLPDPRPVADVKAQVDEALRLRPELTQARQGLVATRALIEAERSNFYPQIFIAARGNYGNAPNRTVIDNPFVPDEFNTREAGAVLGFKLNIDFGITRGRVREKEADHLRVEQLKQFAETGIPLQVRKAYLELLEARKNIQASEDAYMNARKWMVAAAANVDFGIGEAKDLADAVLAFAKMRAENFRAIYNYNLALADLDHATGRAVAEIR